MKSIKPGRGPSKMSAVGSIFVAIFGIIWCIVAGSIGATFMVPFGLLFVGLAIYQAVYHYRNATSQDRYSVVDIVDLKEETDPLNEKYGKYNNVEDEYNSSEESFKYCPYCGKQLEDNFEYCPHCGKKLPN